MPLSSELQNLVKVLDAGKTVCLLAPSFPVDFTYPQIVMDLKKIGFTKVVELTYAAKIINMQYHELIKQDPTKQRICTNCPTIVKFVKTKYPQHTDKLMNIGSPMVIMSRFVKKEYGPEYKTIFVGPCFAKKLEAKETGDVDYAITFQELQQIFDHYTEHKIPIKEFSFDITESGDIDFDKVYNDYTKIFPLTGAVAETLHYKDILKSEQVMIVDEIANMDEAIQNMEKNPNIKFLDALACPGGCIGGPGIISKAPIEERAEKIRAYKEYCKKDKIGEKGGKFEYAEGLDFQNNLV